VGTTFFYFVTNHAFDRRTDRQTNTFLVVRAGIPCSAVMITLFKRNSQTLFCMNIYREI